MNNLQLLIGAGTAWVVLIILPLVLLYLKGSWPISATIPSLVFLPILFFFAYTPLHELSHVAGAYLAGGWVSRIQLFPRLVAGHIITARYFPHAISQNGQFLIMTVFPFLLDVISLVLGLILVRPALMKKPFWAGFLVMLLVLRPAFDFTGETVGFIARDGGDFDQISRVIGSHVTWIVLSVIFVFTLLSMVVVLRRFTRLQPTTLAGESG